MLNSAWRPLGARVFLIVAIAALASVLGNVPGTLAGGARCVLSDGRFQMIKSPSRYALLYLGTVVAQIGEKELRDLYGGEEPDLSCDRDFSTSDLIGVVVGWKHDLLIAYGITRDFDGLPISLNRLGWAPHRNTLAIKVLGPKDLFDTGNGVHICWDNLGDGRWSFGFAESSSCTVPPPPREAAEAVSAVELERLSEELSR
ncbi:hypothetical protein JOH50_006657 [Rhizobium leguminosarum]|nr:hypothetical protein [Rhizobium leguminosarum]